MKPVLTLAALGVAITAIGLVAWRWPKGSGAERDAPTDANTRQAQSSVRRPPDRLTFHRDVAPLIANRCATCHRPDEAAPFSLLTYAAVKEHAADIVAVTGRRYMPPWLPDADAGGPALVGEHERRLSADEI